MTGRILIVDDNPTNIKLLEAKLNAEYFTVRAAINGPQALSFCEAEEFDVVLLDIMMPGMDGYEVCRRLKASPSTAHLPVVMLTALDAPSDRLNGLEAGADDFLTKPINELALMTRVRSLLKLKQLTDELRTRNANSQKMGMAIQAPFLGNEEIGKGRICLLEDRPHSMDKICNTLSQRHTVIQATQIDQVLRENYKSLDVLIINIDLQREDPLRLISFIRSDPETRNLPILALVDAIEDPRVHKAIDMGVNDYIVRPVDKNELLVRTMTQIRKKRYQDKLIEQVKASMELAIVDPLTRLHNRRYLETRLNDILKEKTPKDFLLSMMILDIDYFKSINDTYGHDVGDEVLREFANRLRAVARNIDIVARFGGEEFVVVLPDTDLFSAQIVAERIRSTIEEVPFSIERGRRSIRVTISIGVAYNKEHENNCEYLFKRADQALYLAKQSGRNCVKLST